MLISQRPSFCFVNQYVAPLTSAALLKNMHLCFAVFWQQSIETIPLRNPSLAWHNHASFFQIQWSKNWGKYIKLIHHVLKVYLQQQNRVHIPRDRRLVVTYSVTWFIMSNWADSLLNNPSCYTAFIFSDKDRKMQKDVKSIYDKWNLFFIWIWFGPRRTTP